MKEKILNQLKESFGLYLPFWMEWKEYEFNGLTATEIYMIEVQAKNNFKNNMDDSFMFYNQLDTLKNLIHKLSENFEEFQDWLIIKFQFSIVKFSQGINLELFYKIPIAELQLPQILIQNLQEFNCKNLEELFAKYSDKDFRNPTEFKTIKEFLKNEKRNNHSLRKEVTSLNWN
jgi:hypothetical protein